MFLHWTRDFLICRSTHTSSRYHLVAFKEFFVQQALKMRFWQLSKPEAFEHFEVQVLQGETVMTEEQVIPNLQGLYSQECGLILRLSWVLHTPRRVLVHRISCGNKLLVNQVVLNYTLSWLQGYSSQSFFSFFSSKMMLCFLFHLFIYLLSS